MSAEPPRARPAPDARVLIVADDPLARAGLALLLEREAADIVVGQVTARDDLPGAVQAYRPDVALCDLGPDAHAVADRVADLEPLVIPVLALVADETSAVNAAALGARALLLRDAPGATLLAAVRAVARGLVVLDPGLAAALRPPPDRAPRPSDDLTARESDVLQLLAAGLANKAIAQRLGITDHTVKFHVNAILTKLGAESRTEAVVRAARLGLVIL